MAQVVHGVREGGLGAAAGVGTGASGGSAPEQVLSRAKALRMLASIADRSHRASRLPASAAVSSESAQARIEGAEAQPSPDELR